MRSSRRIAVRLGTAGGLLGVGLGEALNGYASRFFHADIVPSL
jgi:hypothetical protein